jgi:hypothetical protein
MNTKQTEQLTGIPAILLRRLRSRESMTLRGGPPYRRRLTSKGTMGYTYDRAEVTQWMQLKRCLITQGDAAVLMDCSRDEISRYYGLRSFEIRGKKNGKLIIDNGKNFFMWVPILPRDVKPVIKRP